MTALLRLPPLAWGIRGHRFRGHHLEVDGYDLVPVILRHVEQKLIPSDARTRHNDRWRARKAGLQEGGGYTSKHHKDPGAVGTMLELYCVCARARRPGVHLHLFQQAPGGPGLRHVSLEGSVVPSGRPFLTPRPA